MRSAVLVAVALAHRSMSVARGWCADSRIARARMAAKVDRLDSEIALMREELRIKDARMARIEPARRPHYPPEERLAILALRAARGWTSAELGRRFLVTAATVATWMRRLEEDGPGALVQMPEPVNRFPAFVRDIVARLSASFPRMGSVRIAQLLAWASLHIAPSTLRRWAKGRPAPARPAGELPAKATRSGRTVIARHPGHVWSMDLTIVPTSAGFWVPWLPQAIAQRWPFCWWVAVVIDAFSRRVIGFGVFTHEPSALETLGVLDEAAGVAGAPPRYTVTDGAQFQDEYRRWCARHGVRPRYGAVGKYGSIAIIERFMRTLKAEGLCTAAGLVPFADDAMRALVARFVGWYDAERPHQGLSGRTPAEVYGDLRPAHLRPRLEPRARYPARALCAAPRVPIRSRAHGAPLELVLMHPDGALHLPIVKIRRAA